MSTYPQGI